MVRRAAPDRQEDVPVAVTDFSFVKPDRMLGFHEMLIHQKAFFFMIINAPIFLSFCPSKFREDRDRAEEGRCRGGGLVGTGKLLNGVFLDG